MSEIKCLYGFRKSTNSLHHVDEAIEDRSLELVCPACMKKLTPVNGKIRAKHFRHDSSDHDNHCSESALHIRAKTMLAELNELELPFPHDFNLLSIEKTLLSTKRTCHEYISAKVISSNIEVMIVNERIVPDCTLIVDFGDGLHRKVCLEVFVTHAVDDAKLSKIRNTDSIFAEIDLSKSPRDISDDELRKYITNLDNYCICHLPEDPFSYVMHRYIGWSIFHSNEAERRYSEFLQETHGSCSKKINRNADTLVIYKMDMSIHKTSMRGLSSDFIHVTDFKLSGASILITSTIGEYNHDRSTTPYPNLLQILEKQIDRKYFTDLGTCEQERIRAANIEFDLFLDHLKSKQKPGTYSSTLTSTICQLIFNSGRPQKQPTIYGDLFLSKILSTIDRGISNGNFLASYITKSCAKEFLATSKSELESMKNIHRHIATNIHSVDYELHDKGLSIGCGNASGSVNLVKKSALAREIIYSMGQEEINKYVMQVIYYLEKNDVLCSQGTAGLIKSGGVGVVTFFETGFNKKYYREIKRITSSPNLISQEDKDYALLMKADLDLIKNSFSGANLNGYERMLAKILKPAGSSGLHENFSIDSIEVPF